LLDHGVQVGHDVLVGDEGGGPGANVVTSLANLGDLPLLIIEVRSDGTLDDPAARAFQGGGECVNAFRQIIRGPNRTRCAHESWAFERDWSRRT